MNCVWRHCYGDFTPNRQTSWVNHCWMTLPRIEVAFHVSINDMEKVFENSWKTVVSTFVLYAYIKRKISYLNHITMKKFYTPNCCGVKFLRKKYLFTKIVDYNKMYFATYCFHEAHIMSHDLVSFYFYKNVHLEMRSDACAFII